MKYTPWLGEGTILKAEEYPFRLEAVSEVDDMPGARKDGRAGTLLTCDDLALRPPLGVGELEEDAHLRVAVGEGQLTLRADGTKDIHQVDVAGPLRTRQDVLAHDHALDHRLKPYRHAVGPHRDESGGLTRRPATP